MRAVQTAALPTARCSLVARQALTQTSRPYKLLSSLPSTQRLSTCSSTAPARCGWMISQWWRPSGCVRRSIQSQVKDFNCKVCESACQHQCTISKLSITSESACATRNSGSVQHTLASRSIRSTSRMVDLVENTSTSLGRLTEPD